MPGLAAERGHLLRPGRARVHGLRATCHVRLGPARPGGVACPRGAGSVNLR